jgi:hypothetical protein
MWFIDTMEYYSAGRNNDMWLESKWMQMEDIMLREASQAQKHKGRHVFSHRWKVGVKERDLGEGIRWLEFTYLREIEQ